MVSYLNKLLKVICLISCASAPTNPQSPLCVPPRRSKETRCNLPFPPILDWAWQTHAAAHTFLEQGAIWHYHMR